MGFVGSKSIPTCCTCGMSSSEMSSSSIISASESSKWLTGMVVVAGCALAGAPAMVVGVWMPSPLCTWPGPLVVVSTQVFFTPS